jgi:tRNA (guanine37-N1)-methyltransferase
MRFDIITIFPEMFSALNYGIVGRAIKNHLCEVNYYNPRTYSDNKHGYIDDRPYGGGPGMVMMVEPLSKAINAARLAAAPAKTYTIHLSPQGTLLNQKHVEELILKENLILTAGRYEGVDERLIEAEVDAEYSIGDYVLSGGELAAMVLIDSMTRLLPGALGDEDSAKQDSFADGLFDYPHYTRPENVAGKHVPLVLLRGDHAAIARWRLKQAIGRTWLRRPDLLKNRPLTNDEKILLDEFIAELGK